MSKLFHYVHCPFCLRVRFALGFLAISYDSIVLPYNDKKTPVDLCQKKMLPIYQFKEGDYSNESLEIIRRLDQQGQLKCNLLEDLEIRKDIEELLSSLGKPIHSVCMPYWLYTPEFDLASRSYFQEQKEKKRGPFNKLIQNKQQFLTELSPLLKNIENNITPYYKGTEISVLDIMLASHLWGLYIFPEFQFSTKIHYYLQGLKKECSFDYHHDFWK